MNEVEITALVNRLSRPHRDGVVIECSAILAAGADSPAIIDWIVAHDGKPESDAPSTRGLGLHGSRINDGGNPAAKKPMRYVLPAAALAAPSGISV
jgi:hypothetical protein